MKFKTGEYVVVKSRLRSINKDISQKPALVIGMSSSHGCLTITWDGVVFSSIHEDWLQAAKKTTARIPAPEIPADKRSTTEKLVDQIRSRHHKGLKKYGMTVDRNDLEPNEWVQHFREELLDALCYLSRIEDNLKRLKQKVSAKSPAKNRSCEKP